MSDTTQQQTAPAGFISITEHEAALNEERDRFNKMEIKLKKQAAVLRRKLRDAPMSSVPNRKSIEMAPGRTDGEEETSELEGNEKKKRDVSVVISLHEERWNGKYEQLKAFKEANGHCNVPKTEKSLFSWISSHRTSYNKQKLGIEYDKGVVLHPERIHKLNLIGFEWRVRKNLPLAWEERYAQLLEFRDEHGHVKVPQNHSDPQGLGHWVFEQRKMYMKLQQGKKTYATLTPERIQKLESVGFVWSLKNADGK